MNLCQSNKWTRWKWGGIMCLFGFFCCFLLLLFSFWMSSPLIADWSWSILTCSLPSPTTPQEPVRLQPVPSASLIGHSFDWHLISARTVDLFKMSSWHLKSSHVHTLTCTYTNTLNFSALCVSCYIFVLTVTHVYRLAVFILRNWFAFLYDMLYIHIYV